MQMETNACKALFVCVHKFETRIYISEWHNLKKNLFLLLFITDNKSPFEIYICR